MKTSKFMSKLAALALAVALPFTLSAFPYTSVNTTTGDSITAWDLYTALGFDISVSQQTLGVWTPAVNIADPLTSPKDPIASINASSEAIVVWSGNDPLLFSGTIYASINTGSGFGLPVLLSNPVLEHVINGYQVTYADNGSAVVTWQSYIFLTGATVSRAIYMSTLGVWGTPVTL